MGFAARRLERLAESGSDTALILWAELSGDATVLSRVGDLQSPLLSIERVALALGAGVELPDMVPLEELGDLPPGLERCRSDLLLRFGSSMTGSNRVQAGSRDAFGESGASGTVYRSSLREHATVEGELQEWLIRVQSWREVLGV